MTYVIILSNLIYNLLIDNLTHNIGTQQLTSYILYSTCIIDCVIEFYFLEL